MSKKLFALFLAVLLCLSLFGCGGKPEAPSVSAPVGNAPAAPEENTELNLQVQNWMLGAYNKDAYYFLTQRPEDGSYNIKCIDFESGKELFLCNRPECTHDNESCPAWRAYCGSNASVSIINDSLFLSYSGAADAYLYQLYGDACLPRTVRLNLDGSGAQEIAQMNSGESVHGPCAVDADGGFSYQVIQTVQEKSGEIACFYNIAATNLKTGEIKTSRQFDENNLSIETAAGSKLILVYDDTAGAESSQGIGMVYMSYDVLTGETEKLASAPRYPAAARALNGKLYNYKPELQGFEVTDFATGEKSVLYPQADMNSYAQLFPSAMVHGYLYVLATPAVVDEQNAARQEWLVSTEDGSVYPITLPMQVDNPQAGEQLVSICAETETDYLVKTSAAFVDTAFAVAEGSAMYLPVPHYTYALISKEDFRANRPNYRYVTPME